MKPLLIIAGAGQTGRELAGRLTDLWELVVIDQDPHKLERLNRETPGLRLLEGDATSVVLQKRASTELAQAVIGLTGTDEVNLEFCRLAMQRFKVSHCYSAVTNRNLIPRFDQLGIQVISRAFTVASVLQTQLEPGSRTSSELGLGAGELMEVTILAHSPVIGRKLASFHAQSWLVGAIYRRGRLVVPHGQTEVYEGDRVLLIGSPDIIPSVANFFRRGTSEFPLQYGSNVVVSDPERKGEGFSLPEALHLTQQTRAQSLKVLAAPYQDAETLQSVCEFAEVPTSIHTAPDDWPKRVSDLLREHDCGCLVLPGPKPGLLDWMGIGNNALFSLLDSSGHPLLLARGSFPYKKILLVAAAGPGHLKATELAMDVTRMLNAELQVLAVLPPDFISGSEHRDELRAGVEKSASIGAYYTVGVETKVVEGHPLHRAVEEAADFDLLILGYQRGRSSSWASPDVARHLLLRAPCSTLVLPHD